MYIYILRFPRLFLYIELSPVVPIVGCMSSVRDLVRVMCGIKSVLCAGRSLCYVRASVCVTCGCEAVLYRDLVRPMCRLQSVICAVLRS